MDQAAALGEALGGPIPGFQNWFFKCTYVNLKSTLKLATILQFLSAYDFLHCSKVPRGSLHRSPRLNRDPMI